MIIRPMDKDFILFQCLHCGPLSPSNIETKSRNKEGISKEQFERNKKFLTRITDAYGSCAMLAIEGNSVVAPARFYPQIILNQVDFCCHDPKYAITQKMVEMDLPAIENPADRILKIDCFLVHEKNRGQGLSHALIDGILEWAQSNNWKTVRAHAASDNYWVASQICAPMLSTFIKQGFKKTGTVSIPEAKDMLQNIQEGKSGIKKKKEFEKFCGGKDLSDLSLYYEVERRL